jgi:hypothetical protein
MLKTQFKNEYSYASTLQRAFTVRTETPSCPLHCSCHFALGPLNSPFRANFLRNSPGRIPPFSYLNHSLSHFTAPKRLSGLRTSARYRLLLRVLRKCPKIVPYYCLSLPNTYRIRDAFSISQYTATCTVEEPHCTNTLLNVCGRCYAEPSVAQHRTSLMLSICQNPAELHVCVQSVMQLRGACVLINCRGSCRQHKREIEYRISRQCYYLVG